MYNTPRDSVIQAKQETQACAIPRGVLNYVLFIFICPSVGALDGLVPAFDPGSTLFFGEFRFKDPVDDPVLADVADAGPVAYSQTGQISGTHGGGLHTLGTVHRGVAQICLSLHDQIVGAGASVHLQVGEPDLASTSMADSTSATW